MADGNVIATQASPTKRQIASTGSCRRRASGERAGFHLELGLLSLGSKTGVEPPI